MRNRLPAAFVAVLVALAFGGCSCETKTTEIAPEAAAEPMALSFGERCNEFPYDSQFTLTNTTGGNLSADLSVVGDGAAFFSVSPKNISLSGTGASGVITVTYHPSDELAGGESQLGRRHTANVVVAYAGEGGAATTLDIEVSGEVANTSVAPKVSFACGTKPDGSALPRCGQGVTEACCSTYDQGDGAMRFESLGFGSPRVGNTSTLPLRVENLGCGELTVESITVTPQATNCGEGVIATTGMDESPILIPGGMGGGEGHDFSVAFTPDTACTFAGTLTVNAVDASGEPVAINSSILGDGRDAKLTVNRNLLQFGEVTPGTTAEQEFAIRNSGTLPVHVSSIELVNDLENTLDFSITKMERDTCNGTTPSGARTPVTIGAEGLTFAATNAIANCGEDELFVTVRYAPSSPADQDRAHVEIISDEGALSFPELRGGTDPILGHEPDMVEFYKPLTACNGTDRYTCSRDDNQCAFMCQNDGDCGAGETCYGASPGTPGTCFGESACAETCGTATNTVRITNSGFAPLRVSRLYITDASHGEPPRDPNGWDLFEVGTENCTGREIPKDEYCEVEVRFRDKNTGGYSDGYLKVESNDPAHAEVPYFVQLRAITEADTAPVANFVSSPDFPRKEEWVRLDALNSTDDRGIADYQWELRSAATAASFLHGSVGVIDPANPNANCPPTYNGGVCFRFPVAGTTRVIEFRPDIAGSYDFRVTVTDVGCEPAHTGRFNQPIAISN